MDESVSTFVPGLAEPPSPPPARLGKYELLKRIATGGMAEIFLARARGSIDGHGHGGSAGGGGLRGFEKILVIKRMLDALALQPDFVAMFVDEARLAAAMHHPNIVQTFDVGHDDGSYFMAMEYLHGEDLRTLFRALRAQKRRMPLDQVVHVISHVCAGLQYAHDRIGSDGSPLHVVHRDVSPQNVLVTYDGAVKLLDFGIAKAQGRFGETKYGTLKGKIGYMSPEQCRGEPLDRRSDVFTAAILLYELSTGRRLYRGASEYEVLKRIVEGEVPSARRAVAAHGDGADYPEELDRIVARGLAKDPAARYQSAREMAEELETFALQSRLSTSALALARFMEQVFGRKVEEWREAQRAGKDLAQHIVEQSDELVHHEPGEEDLLLLPPDLAAAAPGEVAVPARVDDTPSARPKSASQPNRVLHVPAVEPIDQVSRVGEVGRASHVGQVGPVPPGPPREPTGPLPLVAARLPSELRLATAPPQAPRTGSRAPGPLSWLALSACFLVVGMAAGVVWMRATVERSPAVAPTGAPAAGNAVVEVTTTPAGATVFLDGRAAPAGSVAVFEGVAAGTDHVVVAELPGHHPGVRHLEVAAGGRVRLLLALEEVGRR